MFRYIFLFSLFTVSISIVSLQEFTIRVPGDEPTLQAGIDAATNGETVLVADGLYIGSGNRDVDFNGKAIVVISENGYTVTIIDCESSGRGFYFHNGEGPASIVKGFTIKNGAPGGNGGGIYCLNASPYILECSFVNNSAGIGGGVACDDNAKPVIEDCMFDGNNAGTYGGGLHTNSGSDATIVRCEFFQNIAGAEGGGLRLVNSSPQVSDCVISNNAAGSGGGGLLIRAGTSPSIINCLISNNNSSFVGGGIKVGQGSYPEIIGCEIVGNVANDGGGIMSNNTNGHIITNCTVADNQATVGQGGGIGFDTGAYADVANSIFWSNEPEQIDIVSGSVSISYSDI